MRAALGLTRLELAIRSSLPTRLIIDLEKGRRKPSPENAYHLALALGISCDLLSPTQAVEIETGIRLRQNREEKGLTRVQLAKLAGVPYLIVEQFELHGILPPKEMVEALRKALELESAKEIPQKKPESVGERIQRIRESRGLTLTQLSELSGVPYSTLWGIQQDTQPARYGNLKRIATGLNVAVEQLARFPSLKELRRLSRGTQLKLLRITRGYSLSELARKTGLPESVIRGYEKRTKFIPPTDRKILAAALELPEAYHSLFTRFTFSDVLLNSSEKTEFSI